MNLNGADDPVSSAFLDPIFANALMMPLPVEIRVVPAAEFPHDLQYVQNTLNTGPMNPSHVICNVTKDPARELQVLGTSGSKEFNGRKVQRHVYGSARILHVFNIRAFDTEEEPIDARRGVQSDVGEQENRDSGATSSPKPGETSSLGQQEHRYSGQVLGNAHGRLMPCGWYGDPSEDASDKYVGVLCPVEMWDEPPNEFWNDAAVSAVGGKMWEAYESIYVDEAGDGEAQAKRRRWLE